VQQEVIRLLIDHIVVEKNAITIKHIIPTDDDCRLLPGRRFTQIIADKTRISVNLRSSASCPKAALELMAETKTIPAISIS